MITDFNIGAKYPTVNLAVKKSRLKIYDKNSAQPTYYLNKGDEFQIELFNPTRDTVLASISLNGDKISAGGLILRPGERVFLERFLNTNNKFLFETYNVTSSEAVMEAIKENGDLEVEFYRERKSRPKTFLKMRGSNANLNDLVRGSTSGNVDYGSTTTYNSSSFIDMNNIHNTNGTFNTTSTSTLTTTDNGSVTLDCLSDTTISPEPLLKKGTRKRMKKTIETGRVGQGNQSDQKLVEVSMDFETSVYHTLSFKMLPTSQKKFNTTEVVNVYCTNCGKKNKASNIFCPKCGTKR